MKKLLDENNPENTVVHVVLRTSDNEEYECVGVLMKEEGDTIEIAFNAKNDVVIDDVKIKKTDILSIDIVDPLDIVKMW